MKLLSKKVVKKLIKKRIKISIAESCTGGLLSAAIISINGSSKVFNLGLVTYSNESKIKVLKVSKKFIKKYGAVSKQVCLAMVKNVAKIGKTKMSISVTGIAGPSGGTQKKPVGLVYLGIKIGNKININKFLFINKERSYIQKTTVKKCLGLILRTLK
tara:strand:- start:376 stop:849 length:474 start_codon:yes stop_codon:yes gene_type:complete